MGNVPDSLSLFQALPGSRVSLLDVHDSASDNMQQSIICSYTISHLKNSGILDNPSRQRTLADDGCLFVQCGGDIL